MPISNKSKKALKITSYILTGLAGLALLRMGSNIYNQMSGLNLQKQINITEKEKQEELRRFAPKFK